MKNHLLRGLTVLFIFTFSSFLLNFDPVQAQSQSNWWNEDWPYRIAVQVSEPGATSVQLDFSQLFADLGLVGAILDLQSVRVIPELSGTPGTPIPYEETYSTQIIDGESLNTDDSTGEPFWDVSYPIELSLDDQKSTEGSSSILSTFEVSGSVNFQIGFIYNFNGSPSSDWTQFESLTYDFYPQVNASALDQSPDLFQFKLLGAQDCIRTAINSPALSLDQWNNAIISLAPYGESPSPDLSALTGFEFFYKMEVLEDSQNEYEIGDQIALWLDNFRLVDQNGGGEIRWVAEPGIDTYYIYFDTINHTGHANPTLSDIPVAETIATISGAVEAGGYFHQVSGADPAGLTIWTAPITEKILKGQSAPVTQNALEISAARGEYEAFQIIVHSPADISLPVSVSDLVHESNTIPASAIQIYRVDYVTLTRLSDQYGRLTDWPDPLYPISQGQEVDFPANENQPLWFRIEVPRDAVAGRYTGEISVGSATIPFALSVWNFTLPATSILPFTAGLDLDALLEAYGGTDQGVIQPCYDDLVEAISETLDIYHVTALPPDTEPSPGRIYTLTNYAQEEAHRAQSENDETIWWSFSSLDLPPFANPSIIDRTGQDARILPWMAWVDQIDGLFYHQLTDWDVNPWETPFSNSLANGDGFMFYPPNDATVGYDPCDPESNRLIPSIRLELLREGLEDYAYLRLLGGNGSDLIADEMVGSRTLYQHIPTEFTEMRFELASQIIASQKEFFIPLFID